MGHGHGATSSITLQSGLSFFEDEKWPSLYLGAVVIRRGFGVVFTINMTRNPKECHWECFRLLYYPGSCFKWRRLVKMSRQISRPSRFCKGWVEMRMGGFRFEGFWILGI